MRRFLISYLEFLRTAIKTAHGCESRHVRTVLVNVQSNGVKWEGEVDVFELRNHPAAVQCYAWCEDDHERGSDPIVQVPLSLPPITTPELAVRLFLEMPAKSRQRSR